MRLDLTGLDWDSLRASLIYGKLIPVQNIYGFLFCLFVFAKVSYS